MQETFQNNQHIFISYARGDGHNHAEKLYEALSARGIRAWRDTRNLNPYQDFTAELEKAIEGASQVAVCLTQDTKRDNSFVRREIGYAMAVEKPIIPLMFAPITPLIAIVNLTRIDFLRQRWEAAFAELLERLKGPADAYGELSRPTDPFRDHLEKLYKEIIRDLDNTVFTLIPLHSESAP